MSEFLFNLGGYYIEEPFIDMTFCMILKLMEDFFEYPEFVNLIKSNTYIKNYQ